MHPRLSNYFVPFTIGAWPWTVYQSQIFIGVVTDVSMHNASLQPPKGRVLAWQQLDMLVSLCWAYENKSTFYSYNRPTFGSLIFCRANNNPTVLTNWLWMIWTKAPSCFILFQPDESLWNFTDFLPKVWTTEIHRFEVAMRPLLYHANHANPFLLCKSLEGCSDQVYWLWE